MEQDRLQHKEEEWLNEVLKFVERVGYPTLYSFINALITTRDQVRSSQVSHMLIQHGHSIFDGFRKHQPEVANDWAVRGRSALSDVSSDISPSPLYIPPHCC